jgi:two-component system, response regulator
LNDHNPVDILLVEDNPHDAELTLRALKKHNIAYRCVELSDGDEALEYLFCQGKYAHRAMIDLPKVIFLDLKLPKINGLEVLRAIKADKRTHSIPVVMVTSSQQDPDIRTAYQYGVNSYIVKPVDFHSFTDVMNHLGQYWLQVNKTTL